MSGVDFISTDGYTSRMKNVSKEIFSLYYQATTDNGEVKFASVFENDVKDYISKSYSKSGVLFQLIEVKR